MIRIAPRGLFWTDWKSTINCWRKIRPNMWLSGLRASRSKLSWQAKREASQRAPIIATFPGTFRETLPGLSSTCIWLHHMICGRDITVNNKWGTTLKFLSYNRALFPRFQSPFTNRFQSANVLLALSPLLFPLRFVS